MWPLYLLIATSGIALFVLAYATAYAMLAFWKLPMREPKNWYILVEIPANEMVHSGVVNAWWPSATRCCVTRTY